MLVRAPLTCSPITVRHAWEKNGAAIDVNASPRLRLDPDGTLHVSQTWSGDIGTYTCRVTSVGGNDSRSAHLRVRSARLHFLSHMSSMTDGCCSSPPLVVSAFSHGFLLLSTPTLCACRQLPHAPENPVALLSTTEKRAINLTWAQAFDGNSPLIRYILEVSENSECELSRPSLYAASPRPTLATPPCSLHHPFPQRPHLNASLPELLTWLRRPLIFLRRDNVRKTLECFHPRGANVGPFLIRTEKMSTRKENKCDNADGICLAVLFFS